MALGTLLPVTVALALTLLLTDAPGAQPRTARVGLLASSSEANFGPNVTVIREALREAGWVEGRNLTLDVRRPTELEAAFETMRRGHADALVLVADPMLFTERPSIIQLAARHRVSAVYEHRLFAEIGGLVS